MRSATRGISLVEVAVLGGVALLVLLPVLTVAQRSVRTADDLLTRSMAEGLCFDLLERLERYKVFWPLPGTPPSPGTRVRGPPLEELFAPVDVEGTRAGPFESAYLGQMDALGMEVRPSIERVEVPGRPGLFLLTVQVAWRDPSGAPRSIRMSRYAFAL